ncbi:hypothetical protein JST97_16050 [bacterium]|nr:hypothetical protein [bacterium]
MMDIPAAAGHAFARTQYLLWERRSFSRWWRYALLSFLTGGSGGFNFKVPAGQSIDFKKKFGVLGLALATASLAEFDTRLVPLILVAGLGIIFLGIFFGWLSSCAQFVLLESVVYDRHVLGESFGRLKGKGTGLFLWTVVVSLVFLLPVGAVGFGAALLASASDNPLLNLPVTMGAISLIGLLILSLCVLFSLTHHFVIPVAYRQKVGVQSGWGLVAGSLGRQKWGVLLFLLALIALSLVFMLTLGCALMLSCGIALVGGGLVLSIPAYLLYQAHMELGLALCVGLLGLLLMGTFLVTLLAVQTPFSVFSRCFGIYAMQQMLPEFGLLPLGGRPDKIAEEPIPSEEPQPLGSLTEDSWQASEL